MKPLDARRRATWKDAIAGNAAIEFALILPVLLLFAAGLVEFGRAYQVTNAVNRLATRDALTYADCVDSPAGMCNAEIAIFTAQAAIQNIAPMLNNGSVALRMFQVAMSNATPPMPTVTYPWPNITPLTATEIAQAQTMIGAGETGVVVTANYTHTLQFFSRLITPFYGASKAISYTVAQRKS